MTVIYRELPRRGIAFHLGGAIQDRQDPTDKSVWGKMVLRVWPPVIAVYLPGLLFFRAMGDPAIMGTVMVPIPP